MEAVANNDENRRIGCEKSKEYYYQHKQQVNERHLTNYYKKKAVALNINVDKLTLNEIKCKIFEYKLNELKK